MFFFASMYAQISLGGPVSEAGLYLMTFFAGFAVAAQFGGRCSTTPGQGPRRARLRGRGRRLRAVGLELTDLDFNDQWSYIVIAGAGIGLMLGPANTDAINRAPRVNVRRGVPASPRRCATTAPASAWPSSAPS